MVETKATTQVDVAVHDAPQTPFKGPRLLRHVPYAATYAQPNVLIRCLVAGLIYIAYVTLFKRNLFFEQKVTIYLKHFLVLNQFGMHVYECRNLPKTGRTGFLGFMDRWFWPVRETSCMFIVATFMWEENLVYGSEQPLIRMVLIGNVVALLGGLAVWNWADWNALYKRTEQLSQNGDTKKEALVDEKETQMPV